MRTHLIKLSFAAFLGGALLSSGGVGCSSNGAMPTGSAGRGGSTTTGTAGSGGGTAGTGAGTAGTGGGTGGDATGTAGTGGSATGTAGTGGGTGGATGGSGGGTGGTGGTLSAQQQHDMLINAATSGGVNVTRTAPTVSYPTCQ